MERVCRVNECVGRRGIECFKMVDRSDMAKVLGMSRG